MTLSSKTPASSYFSAFLLPIVWATLIFLLSSQPLLPSFEISVLDYVFKKCAHMFEYAVLYMLLYRATRKTFTSPTAIIWLPIAVTFAYAISDEIHQHFVPGRYGTIRDVGYDMLGVGIVFLRQYRYI